MYQLGIRKQDTDGMLITTFESANSIDYMLDQAGEADCKEAIILQDGKAMAYKEFRRKTK